MLVILVLSVLIMSRSYDQETIAIYSCCWSLGISFLILEEKNQFGNYRYILLALLSGLMGLVFGALGGLIPAAYLTTKQEINIGLLNNLRLIKALRHEKDVEIRKNAAHVLGIKGNQRAVEPLIKALGDSNEKVRKEATEALVKIGIHAVEPLIKSLNDFDTNVRTGAMWALGNIGDQRAVEPLIRALNDSGGNVREAAAWALGNIGDQRAVEPLIKALNDSGGNVREITAYYVALGRIGDQRAVELLIKALSYHNYEIRKAAARSLITIYYSKKIDRDAKNRILGTKALITKPHQDKYVVYTGSSDCNDPHTDNYGIGLDFPI